MNYFLKAKSHPDTKQVPSWLVKALGLGHHKLTKLNIYLVHRVHNPDTHYHPYRLTILNIFTGHKLRGIHASTSFNMTNQNFQALRARAIEVPERFQDSYFSFAKSHRRNNTKVLIDYKLMEKLSLLRNKNLCNDFEVST